jgi:GNAT superfamily N-acetyltransferase
VIGTFGAYELDDDRDRIDSGAVWDFLSTEAYWGRDRVRADFQAQLASAWRVGGGYEAATGRLADVFILPEARGTGLGQELVATMIDRGPGAGFRWALHTSDAHGLYRKYGFTEPNDTYLERPRPSQTAARTT